MPSQRGGPGQTNKIKAGVVCRVGRLDGAAVWTELRYDTRKPFELTMVFVDRGNVAIWLFARDLLVDGLTGPVGVGDVKVHPTPDGGLVVSLTGDDAGNAGNRLSTDMHFPAWPVQRFVEHCLALVPIGAEEPDADLDGELAALLGGRQ